MTDPKQDWAYERAAKIAAALEGDSDFVMFDPGIELIAQALRDERKACDARWREAFLKVWPRMHVEEF